MSPDSAQAQGRPTRACRCDAPPPAASDLRPRYRVQDNDRRAFPPRSARQSQEPDAPQPPTACRLLHNLPFPRSLSLRLNSFPRSSPLCLSPPPLFAPLSKNDAPTPPSHQRSTAPPQSPFGSSRATYCSPIFPPKIYPISFLFLSPLLKISES